VLQQRDQRQTDETAQRLGMGLGRRDAWSAGGSDSAQAPLSDAGH
jgi:hypothetical protein